MWHLSLSKVIQSNFNTPKLFFFSHLLFYYWLSKRIKLLLECHRHSKQLLFARNIAFRWVFYKVTRLLYLVVVVGCATGVQAGKESLCLVLYTRRGWHWQEESGQLQSCSLIFLLFRFTDMQLTLLPEKKRVKQNIYSFIMIVLGFFFIKKTILNCLPFH